MLCIYTSRSEVPSDKETVFDNEAYFLTHPVNYNDDAKIIIKDIECGSYMDKFRFLDRFGVFEIGVWFLLLLGADSGTGKTYLFSLLKDASKCGLVRCCSITYDSTQKEEDIINTIRNTDADVICLDRLDLYIANSIGKAIGDKEDSCIILMDLKDINRLAYFAPTPVDIEISEDKIEVS